MDRPRGGRTKGIVNVAAEFSSFQLSHLERGASIYCYYIYDIDCDIFVVAIQVRIFGGPDIYVREGSSLQLECVISQTIVSPKVSPYFISS